MYSYEDRLKAVKPYIQYDKSYASVFRELGCPLKASSFGGPNITDKHLLMQKQLNSWLSLTVVPFHL